MERNRFQGFCGFCGAPVPPLEGVVDSSGRWPGLQIVCAQHAPPGALDVPEPAEALRLTPLRADRFHA